MDGANHAKGKVEMHEIPTPQMFTGLLEDDDIEAAKLVETAPKDNSTIEGKAQGSLLASPYASYDHEARTLVTQHASHISKGGDRVGSNDNGEPEKNQEAAAQSYGNR